MTAPVSSAPDRRVEQLALGAGLVTVVFWASAFVGIRAAAADLTPGAFVKQGERLAVTRDPRSPAAIVGVATTDDRPEERPWTGPWRS